MNEHIKTIIESANGDVEQVSIAVIIECAKLNDSWIDSGSFITFGERLKSHFGIQNSKSDS